MSTSIAVVLDRAARRSGAFLCFVCMALLTLRLSGCTSSSPSGTGAEAGAGGSGGAGVYSGGDTEPVTTGTIAYTRGDQLRLIEPDGTGDHLVWSAPATGAEGVSFVITAPAWRPNGWEIAFSSNHEEAWSSFERDLYAIRPDGVSLRKLTNAPTREQAATYPKGSVRVTVENQDVDALHFTLIVQGADPAGLNLSPGEQQTVTIQGVADLGDGVPQATAVAYGMYRWFGPNVDVKAGATVDATPVILLHARNALVNYQADEPFWRSDSSKVGYLGAYCALMETAASPPPGHVDRPLVNQDAFFLTCHAEWGPAVVANRFLAVDESALAETSSVHVLEITEGATTKPAPVFSPEPDIQIPDLHWLPDGSGFVFARRGGGLDFDLNVWEYDFGTGTAKQLTDVRLDGRMRRFAMSPDGSQIAFELVDRTLADLPGGFCDLWVMQRDGSGARRLVEGAAYPAWNPTR
jgi:TolB protein